MQAATFFHRHCPICARPLQIRIEYLGRTVRCPHCGAEFTARDAPEQPDDSAILQRVSQLLGETESGR